MEHSPAPRPPSPAIPQWTNQARLVLNELLRAALEPVPLTEQLETALGLLLGVEWLQIEKKGAIFLVDESEGALLLTVQRGLDVNHLSRCSRVPLGHCLCGLAARDGRLLYVPAVDERHLIRYEGMLPHGHYCIPIVSRDRVLGLVTLYIQEHQRQSREAEEFLDAVGNILAGMVERKLNEERLHLTAKVFASTHDAIVVTDRANRIIDVNPAFSRITLYSREESLGKDPGFMKSGRHDRAFYARMWQSLWQEGRWQGEIWDRRKNDEVYPKWLTIDTVKDDKGEITNCVGVFSDISERKAAEAQLTRLAYHDPLTDLPNRLLFQDRLEHELSLARRNGTRVALLFIDLDRFKQVNDTLGHAVGDQLLVEATRRIRACLREADTVARMGGDEFTVILNDVHKEKPLARLARQIIDSLRLPMTFEGQEVTIGASIGIAIHPTDGQDFTTLTKHADAAMYLAKESGRNTYKFFQPEIQAATAKRLSLENELIHALERQEFFLLYQPIACIRSGRIVGAEALIRWQHPQRGTQPPGEFIPVAEDSDLILDLGEWTLRTACQQLREWQRAGLEGVTMAVNLAARQMRQPDLPRLVERILAETGVGPGSLELEITESSLMEQMEVVGEVAGQLRELGVGLSLDDFGTGYSSLSHLKRFPITTVKIDRSFVGNVTANRDDRTIVAAIISMARRLKLHVIAEGVEQEEQAAFLRLSGCQQMQGYLLSRPVPASEMAALASSHNRSSRRPCP